MAIEFSLAKNGEKTCSLNGLFFHSKYNPQNEGNIFAQGIEADFSPTVIILISPALGYCAQPLRQRFPHTKLVAVEFTREFSEARSLFDEYFVVEEENSHEVCEKIFFSMGEEKIFLSLPVFWAPSAKIFAEKVQKFLPTLRQLYELTKTAVATRSNFAKVWLKNSFRFFITAKNPILPKKTNLPVLITASGTTLEKSIEAIGRYKNCFFIIALSSAVEVLLENQITPDLILTTDGGFWAKMHLNPKKILDKKIPVAMSCESAVFGSLLEKNPIVPLDYGDDCCKLFACTDFPRMKAMRNGTVSGTAVDFALKLTSSTLFVCGMDLSTESYRGKMGVPAHTLPNNLEAQNEVYDHRLKPMSTRLFASSAGSAHSLEIYARWFEQLPKKEKSRIVRIKTGGDEFFRHIDGIKEENWEDFENKFSFSASEKDNLFFSPEKISAAKIRRELTSFLKKTEAAFLKAEQGASLSEEENGLLSLVDYGLFLQLKKQRRDSEYTAQAVKTLLAKLKGELQKF